MAEAKKSRAFTLIELLVVISIIAVLMAILMPTLRKARDQARLVSCSANAKQIGAIMVVYQSDNDGYVPVMRNKWATYISAKTSLLSIPFRNYSGTKGSLPSFLDPDIPWDEEMRLEFAQNYLPDFYVCPFVRGKSQAELWHPAGTVVIGPGLTRTNYVSTGRGDSYSTWIWEQPRSSLKKGAYWITNHPYGPDHGKSKYDNVVWHTGGDADITGCWPNQANNTCRHGKFDQVHVARFSNVPRLSERTAIYCAHGEIDMSYNSQINNFGSHKKGNRGGTNVVFGDGRVGWVQGSQITAW